MKKIISLFIIGTIIADVIIILLSMHMYNYDFQQKSDIRSFYQTANRIDNKNDFNYLLETGAGRSIIQSKISTNDPVTLPQISTKKKFIQIKAIHQEYLSHIETYETTDSKGNVEMHTRIVSDWETINRETKTSKTIMFFNHSYSVEIFNLSKYEEDIPVKDIDKNSKDTDNVQDTGNDKRTIWVGIPESVNSTFYADLSQNGLQPIKFPGESRDKQIKLHKNQPIKAFLKNELDANSPHPIFWSIMTTLIIILVDGLTFIAFAHYTDNY